MQPTQPQPTADPQELWWKEDAERLNRMGDFARDNNLCTKVGAKPMDLNPDGSENDGADAAGLDMAKRLREEHPEAADQILAAALKKNGAKPKA